MTERTNPHFCFPATPREVFLLGKDIFLALTGLLHYEEVGLDGLINAIHSLHHLRFEVRNVAAVNTTQRVAERELSPLRGERHRPSAGRYSRLAPATPRGEQRVSGQLSPANMVGEVRTAYEVEDQLRRDWLLRQLRAGLIDNGRRVPHGRSDPDGGRRSRQTARPTTLQIGRIYSPSGRGG